MGCSSVFTGRLPVQLLGPLHRHSPYLHEFCLQLVGCALSDGVQGSGFDGFGELFEKNPRPRRQSGRSVSLAPVTGFVGSRNLVGQRDMCCERFRCRRRGAPPSFMKGSDIEHVNAGVVLFAPFILLPLAFGRDEL